MKTILITTIAILALSFAGIQTVSAHGGNHGGGYGYCDDETYEGSGARNRSDDSYDKFHKMTSDIRREIAVKKNELKALLRQDNPDEKRAAQLSGELFDLKEKLFGEAEKAGISNRFEHGPAMMKKGGRGRGRHMMDW